MLTSKAQLTLAPAELKLRRDTNFCLFGSRPHFGRFAFQAFCFVLFCFCFFFLIRYCS